MDPAGGEANLLAAALARDVGWCAKHQIESTPQQFSSAAKVLLTFEEEEENFPPLVCHPFLNFPSLSSLPLAHFLTFPVICKEGGVGRLRGRCLGVTGRSIKHH